MSERAQTNNAGYAITVDSMVENAAGVLEVNARHIDPISGGSYAQVITRPYNSMLLDPMFFWWTISLKTICNKQFAPVTSVLKSTVNLTTTPGVIAVYRRPMAIRAWS